MQYAQPEWALQKQTINNDVNNRSNNKNCKLKQNWTCNSYKIVPLWTFPKISKSHGEMKSIHEKIYGNFLGTVYLHHVALWSLFPQHSHLVF